MLPNVWAVALSAALGTGPYPGTTVEIPQAGAYGGGVPFQGSVDVSDVPGTTGAYGAQLYPYDQQDPWLHGHYQEIPAYGGYGSFRPYNYKNVFSQSQTAAGWGAAPTMPYSHQFWHRYHQFATQGQRANAYPPAPAHYPPQSMGRPRSFTPGVSQFPPRPGAQYPGPGLIQYEQPANVGYPAAGGREIAPVQFTNPPPGANPIPTGPQFGPQTVDPTSFQIENAPVQQSPLTEDEIYELQQRQQREQQRPIPRSIR